MSIPHHKCRVRTCQVAVKGHSPICPKHFALVPKDIQKRISQHFNVGQSNNRRPSPEWSRAVADAVAAVEKAAKT